MYGAVTTAMRDPSNERSALPKLQAPLWQCCLHFPSHTLEWTRQQQRIHRDSQGAAGLTLCCMYSRKGDQTSHECLLL